MIELIVFLPLFGFLYCAFFGNFFNDLVSQFVTTTLLFISAIFSWIIFFNYLLIKETQIVYLANWITSDTFIIDWALRVDSLTTTMLIVVTSVSACVHLYSIGYMSTDKSINRFMGYLSLFTFFMLMLVTSNNLLQMFFGWEGVGLASYLLIGFWNHKDSANKAAIKAFIVNRIGDFGFALGIVGIFFIFGSINFDIIFSKSIFYENHKFLFLGLSLSTLDILCLLLFIGAMGKSAQLGLHTWLPDAMEGPTPVSALMHAATMVAAGVYLSVRLFPLFTPDALLFIAYVGGFTAIFAASIAITQNDIKKVLAYSTVSQLGYMILAVGTGAYVAGFFHLVTHAMFKACLFYGSGSVIHAMHHSLHNLNDHDTDPQDMRNMGGFKSKMPITYWTMLVATLAISGVPLFSGFLSKDAVLAGTLSFASHHPQHFLLPVFGFSAALITAFYMFRLIFMTFHNKPKLPDVYKDIHESPKPMVFPLILLSSLSVFIFYTLPYFNPLSDHGWFMELIKAQDSMVPGNPSAQYIAEGIHHSHTLTMILSILVASLGILLSWAVYIKNSISADDWSKKLGVYYNLSLNKYYFDENYNKYLYQPFLRLSNRVSYIDWDLYDKYFINGFGRITKWLSIVTGRTDYDGLDQTIIDGLGRSMSKAGSSLKEVQTGRLQNYMLFALFGVIIIIIFQSF